MGGDQGGSPQALGGINYRDCTAPSKPKHLREQWEKQEEAAAYAFWIHGRRRRQKGKSNCAEGFHATLMRSSTVLPGWPWSCAMKVLVFDLQRHHHRTCFVWRPLHALQAFRAEVNEHLESPRQGVAVFTCRVVRDPSE
eukprot:1162033-Pelagomonas_calceolata.AAC.7